MAANDAAVISSSGDRLRHQGQQCQHLATRFANGIVRTDTDVVKTGFKASTTTAPTTAIWLWMPTAPNLHRRRRQPPSKPWAAGDTLVPQDIVKGADGTPATSRSPSMAGTMPLDLPLLAPPALSPKMRASMAQGNGDQRHLSVTDADAGQSWLRAGTTHGTYGDFVS